MSELTKWDYRFIDLAWLVSTWSKDPSTKVGAVIVDEHNHILGVGFNGFPKGVPDASEDYEDRDVKYQKIVHAEVNAVINATGPVRGCSIYTTFPPCSTCTGILINAGIERFIFCRQPSERYHDWYANLSIATGMLVQAGRRIVVVDD